MSSLGPIKPAQQPHIGLYSVGLRAYWEPIMRIGHTQTPIRFRMPPDDYMARGFAEAPKHHCALSIGHNAALFQKVGELMQIEHVTL